MPSSSLQPWKSGAHSTRWPHPGAQLISPTVLTHLQQYARTRECVCLSGDLFTFSKRMEEIRDLLGGTRPTGHSICHCKAFNEKRQQQNNPKENQTEMTSITLRRFLYVEGADSAPSQVLMNTGRIHKAHSNSRLPFYIKGLLWISSYQHSSCMTAWTPQQCVSLSEDKPAVAALPVLL